MDSPSAAPGHGLRNPPFPHPLPGRRVPPGRSEGRGGSRDPASSRLGPPALALALALGAAACGGDGGADSARAPTLRFAVSFPAGVADSAFADSALDGRLLVILAADTSREPRFQVSSEPDRSAQVVGVQVRGLEPGREVAVTDSVFGYPMARLSDVPPGDYLAQALLNRYETFHLEDGTTVELPPDRGEGQRWNRKPGNLYSATVPVRLGPSEDGPVRLSLDRVIPEVEPPEDTPWIRHVRVRSDLLTAFWGRPTFLQATVLLPAGFAERPDERYPLVVWHGHFGRGIPGWRTEPPDSSLPAPDTTWLYAHCATGGEEGCGAHGMARHRQELGWRFFRWWSGPDAPRALLMTVQHANPWYDDSYAVNSANVGPYGDAITRELIPEVETRLQGIGAGWARTLMGGSTGGWEALGAQVFYPDDYNGAWAFCPDPVDFHAYQAVDVYGDANAYRREGPFGVVEVPGARDHLGRVRYQMADENHMELVLGTRGRSGGQWDIWQAVFGPRGDDGYPAPVWDKRTGRIDAAVAAYWRENYDLTHILERDWAELGPKLTGKLHVYVGTMDSYYLNDAVRFMEETVRGLREPPARATFEYGERAEHCWTGDHDHPNWVASATVVPRFLPEMARRIAATAPPSG